MGSRKKPDNLQNLETEHEGLALLRKVDKAVYVPTKVEKLAVLKMMGVSEKFVRTFDALRLKVPAYSKIKNAKDFELIEVKVTQKALDRFPEGFFFGMTENEEMLLKVLEPNFKLCLVSMAGAGHFRYLTYSELVKLVRNRRIQFQVNL